MLEIRDELTYQLAEDENGPHVFGGPATHKGVTPSGSTVPVHKLLTIDLQDSAIPFRSKTVRYLPLYYPLKYGIGGSSMQYSVLSDLIASVPPKPIPGHAEIWWEFEGAYMLFHFFQCRGCGTIISTNRCD